MIYAIQHKQIRVDGMTGDDCCQKVTDALNNVDGITVESVEVGSVTLSAEDEKAVNAARATIDEQGFSARSDLLTPPRKNDSGEENMDDLRSQQGTRYTSQNSSQNAATGISRAVVQGAEQVGGNSGGQNARQGAGQNTGHGAGLKPAAGRQAGDRDVVSGDDEDAPTADLDPINVGIAKKPVGDAGRDDRDRGDPMPERVKGNPPNQFNNPRGEAKPANRDPNPTTNLGTKGTQPGTQR